MNGMASFRHIIALTALATITACGGTDNNASGPTNPALACAPDVPVVAGLFTSPPTDINYVAGVTALGNLSPGRGHTLSVDHMYLEFPPLGPPGTVAVPVYAMGDGELFFLGRDVVQGQPGYDYELYIKHSCSVSSVFLHLHELSPAVEAFIATHEAKWQDLSTTGDGPWLLFLGQPDGSPTMPLAAGDVVGATRNYSISWDVGVVDTRYINGNFVNTSTRRYPNIEDYLALLPMISADFSLYEMGNRTLNAACFIDYMDAGSGMQSEWFNLLKSNPKSCGRVGWDIPGQLRGAWFNPAIDSAAAEVLFDIEAGALSIIPDNADPLGTVQIGFGNDSGDTTPSLALLDPSTWSPPISGVDQISQAFFVAYSPVLPETVNPDPTVVGVGETVCYDLPYWTGDLNYVLFQLTDSTTLRVKYDPTDYTTPQCAGLSLAFPEVDASWATYIR